MEAEEGELSPYCIVCGRYSIDFYVVKDEIWKAAELGRGLCCVDCLEGRLGRELTISDFDTEQPMNRLLVIGYRLGRQAREGDPIPELPPWPPERGKVNIV